MNINDYPLVTSSSLRYSDTDRQGHVNNAVFSMLLEVGRSEALCHPDDSLLEPGREFVIVQLTLNFLAEITWPGQVFIGSRIASLGSSSFRFEQALFQNEKCAATSECAIVLLDQQTRRSTALSPKLRARLEKMR